MFKWRELLQQAGFDEITVITEQLDCRYPDTAAYWQEIALSFVGPRLACLNSDTLDRFKAEHLAEMESQYAHKDILIEFPTHFSVARKHE